MGCLVAACTLAGTVALMFSTFLNPFFAAGATATVLGLPALAAHALAVRWAYSIPVYMLIAEVLNSSFKSPRTASGLPIALAVMETAGFGVAAAQIFSRVDIAVAVE